MNDQIRANQIIAVILAGGYGTRVQHLLPNIPKPMASVAGKPFVEWILAYLENQGVRQAILSTGYLAEVIEEHFPAKSVGGIQICCSREASPLGTGGGFLQAVRQVNQQPEGWLVMNGDSLAVTELAQLTNYLLDESVDGVILGISMADASRYGSLEFDEDKNLVNFAEKQQGSSVINAGVYLFRQRLLEKFPSKKPLSFEQDVFPTLLAHKARLKVHIVIAPFLDIGTPESLPQAEAFIQEDLRQWLNQC